MSSPAALATVTATLKSLLHGLVDNEAKITTQPPSKARSGDDEQINIFLYGTQVNTAFNNSPLPGTSRNGESAYPPMPLTLKYLITAYGANDDDISGQQLMGQLMSLLHDHPILGPTDIIGIMPDSNLHHQTERIRITADGLSLDEMSKLWASFQSAEYRLSVGYEVSLVLIESTRPTATPLPVLTRGEADQGVLAQASLIPPYPALIEIELLSQQESAVLGDSLLLKGHHLSGASRVRFNHQNLANPVEIAVMAGGTDTQLRVDIPNAPAGWRVGVYAVEVVINKVGGQSVTNIYPLTIAPQILSIAPPNPVARNGVGAVALTLTCSPNILPQQRASLLLGGKEVLAQAHPASTNTVNFIVESAAVGTRHVRLRIDGIDSLLINKSVTPPVFDAAMEVVIV
ncbi:DUF4255 domain-containing protein [Neptunomonas japonica]|uniref:DUF4255 domain-containing protein n=1 Tax=Neptunomonas japonica TaxID=417574 RepID=UPI00040FB0AF|nr:DUF4255 domain-containing protein [Neptunomonas japonica]